MLWILLIVGLVILAFGIISAYNTLIALKNQVMNAWKQIDVQLKRRHDLIPNLLESVKGAMAFERETLESVVLDVVLAHEAEREARVDELEQQQVARRILLGALEDRVSGGRVASRTPMPSRSAKPWMPGSREIADRAGDDGPGQQCHHGERRSVAGHGGSGCAG